MLLSPSLIRLCESSNYNNYTGTLYSKLVIPNLPNNGELCLLRPVNTNKESQKCESRVEIEKAQKRQNGLHEKKTLSLIKCLELTTNLFIIPLNFSYDPS